VVRIAGRVLSGLVVTALVLELDVDAVVDVDDAGARERALRQLPMLVREAAGINAAGLDNCGWCLRVILMLRAVGPQLYFNAGRCREPAGSDPGGE